MHKLSATKRKRAKQTKSWTKNERSFKMREHFWLLLFWFGSNQHIEKCCRDSATTRYFVYTIPFNLCGFIGCFNLDKFNNQIYQFACKKHTGKKVTRSTTIDDVCYSDADGYQWIFFQLKDEKFQKKILPSVEQYKSIAWMLMCHS